MMGIVRKFYADAYLKSKLDTRRHFTAFPGTTSSFRFCNLLCSHLLETRLMRSYSGGVSGPQIIQHKTSCKQFPCQTLHANILWPALHNFLPTPVKICPSAPSGCGGLSNRGPDILTFPSPRGVAFHR